MIRRMFFSAIALPFLSACAAYQGSPSEFAPQQPAALEATCTKVMGLTKGEAEFSGCVSSLSATIAGQLQAKATNNAYRDCVKMGLKSETPEFSRCVLDRENSQSGLNNLQTSPASGIDVSYYQPNDGEIRSYFRMTAGERRRQEQYSCADLGINPGSGGFVSCVDNLDMTLFGIDHPNS